MRPLRPMFRVCLFLALALLALSAPVAAQDTEPTPGDPVTLVADTVRVEPEGVLVAEGDVEVYSGTRVLRASRITFNEPEQRLYIEGPIRLTDAGGTIIIADAADLSPDLRDGLVEGARLILGQQVQVAAGDMRRHDGRFTDMRSAVATSCEVCRPGQTPLWQIRARRVVHDEDAQRLYFENAQLRVLGVPIFWLPAMSAPEPGVERARGFLVPSSETSNLLGTGVKLPYFIPLGDHADLTLTPYLSTDLGDAYTNTLEFRYRQAFRKGTIQFLGAVSDDSIMPETRSYLFGQGRFDLPDRVKLNFGIQVASDDNYLNDYDYSGADRLETYVALDRIVDDTRATGRLSHFHSLRDDEDNDTLPTLVGDLRFDRRWTVPGAGFVDFALIGHAHERPSDENIDGRDSAHARGYLRWSHEVTAGPGLRLGADARLIGDMKQIWQDDRYDELQTAVTPGIALTARLPLSKPGRNGVAYLIEPVAQLVWSGDYDIDAPNDDSTQPGFDTGNLLGFQRFPGLDRVEDDLRANLAIGWKRVAPGGLTLGLTLGQVLRAESSDLFSVGTGLDGMRSDWMAQVDIDWRNRLSLRSLTLVDDDGSPTLNETRLNYRSSALDVSAGYVWQIADEELEQDSDLSEMTLEAAYRITDTWSAELDVRQDFISERTTRAGLGLTYQNECVRVDLSGVRRFRNTSEAEPTITYGLTVSLTGFGNGGGSRRASRCAG